MMYTELLDYRRRVAGMYARARRQDLPPEVRWQNYRAEREQLFRTHPQSALSESQKERFSDLAYFNYNPALRFLAPIDTDVRPDMLEVPLQDEGLMRMVRFGKVRLQISGTETSLSLFWILGYGGGVFLPFRDGTNSVETYAGGRYLLDTIKHADLGQVDDQLILDFNYAYNPSCAYHPRWHCPLAPPENWLDVRVQAGERSYPVP